MKIKIIFISILFIVVFSFIMYFLPVGKDADEGIKKAKADSVENIVRVTAEKARLGDLAQYVYTQGYAEALRQTPVTLKSSGYINKIVCKNGQKVKKGEVLLQLENQEQEIALSEARSSLIKAVIDFGVKVENRDSAIAYIENILNSDNIELNSLKMNFSKNILKGNRRNEVLAVQSGLIDAYNKYRRAKLNYSNTIFKAPFSGVVGDIKFKKSQLVQAGVSVAVLYDLSIIKFNAPILEDDVPDIKQGATVVLYISALSGNEYRAEVKEVNPAIDTEKRTMAVGIYLGNKDNKIKPGMSARIKIETGVYKNRLLVPKKAVLMRDGRELVFIVRANKAVWCYVTTGKKNDQFVEILSSVFNLKAGEPVITEGHFSIAHGARVSCK